MDRVELRDVGVAAQVRVKMGKVMGSFREEGLSLCEAIMGRSQLSNTLRREGRAAGANKCFLGAYLCVSFVVSYISLLSLRNYSNYYKSNISLSPPGLD